jgi:hypothetical protein
MVAEVEFQHPRRVVLFDEMPVRLGTLLRTKIQFCVVGGRVCDLQ